MQRPCDTEQAYGERGEKSKKELRPYKDLWIVIERSDLILKE